MRRVATASVVAAFGLLVGFDGAMRERYDLGAVGARLAQFEREGRPVAIEGNYHGQWTLAGACGSRWSNCPTTAWRPGLPHTPMHAA